jgi:hypothetical protein
MSLALFHTGSSKSGAGAWEGFIVGRDGVGAIDGGFFWFTCLFLAVSPAMPRAQWIYFLFLLGVALYLLLTRTFVLYWNVAALSGLGVLYTVLSYLDALPNGWTRHYDIMAIPQQASFVATFYPTLLAARRFWHYILARPARRFFWLGVASGPCAAAMNYLSLADQAGYIDAIGVYRYALPNFSMLFYIATYYYVTIEMTKMNLKLAALCILLFLTTVSSLQAVILVIGIAAIFLCRRPDQAAFGAAFLTFALQSVSIAYIVELWAVYPDAGIRAAMARDSLITVWDSYGLGVGYGKEAIRNIYSDLGHVHINFYNNQLDGDSYLSFLFTGAHNSFFGEFHRLGLLGGLLIIWLFCVSAFPRFPESSPIARLGAIIYVMMIVTMSVNVALESPTYSIGVIFAFALLYSLKELCASESYY